MLIKTECYRQTRYRRVEIYCDIAEDDKEPLHRWLNDSFETKKFDDWLEGVIQNHLDSSHKIRTFWHTEDGLIIEVTGTIEWLEATNWEDGSIR